MKLYTVVDELTNQVFYFGSDLYKAEKALCKAINEAEDDSQIYIEEHETIK